jgi:hypothetical protein
MFDLGQLVPGYVPGAAARADRLSVQNNIKFVRVRCRYTQDLYTLVAWVAFPFSGSLNKY